MNYVKIVLPYCYFTNLIGMKTIITHVFIVFSLVIQFISFLNISIFRIGTFITSRILFNIYCLVRNRSCCFNNIRQSISRLHCQLRFSSSRSICKFPINEMAGDKVKRSANEVWIISFLVQIIVSFSFY